MWLFDTVSDIFLFAVRQRAALVSTAVLLYMARQSKIQTTRGNSSNSLIQQPTTTLRIILIDVRPCHPYPTPPSHQSQSPLPMRFRRSIKRQPDVSKKMAGLLRMRFNLNAQKVVRYCCLILPSVIARREPPPSRSFCSSAFAPPLPPSTTAPTPNPCHLQPHGPSPSPHALPE